MTDVRRSIGERIHLEEQSLKLRVMQTVTAWVALMVAIYVKVSWFLIVGCVLLVLLCIVGFYGATPSSKGDAGASRPRGAGPVSFEFNEGVVEAFRAGLLAWTGVFVVFVASYLIFYTVDDVVEDRCSPGNAPFVELYGNNCTDHMTECEDTCVRQVRFHLVVQIILVTLGVAGGLLFVAGQAQSLLDDKALIEANDFELPGESKSS